MSLTENKFVKYRDTFFGISPNTSGHVRIYKIDEWGRNIPLGWLNVADMPDEVITLVKEQRPWAAQKLQAVINRKKGTE